MRNSRRPVLPPVHDPKWVERRCRELSAQLGLVYRVWFKEDDLRYGLLQSKSPAHPQQRKVYLSAGIHGDEPGSILGLIAWLEQSERWMKKFHFTIYPCLNPGGLRLNARLDSGQRDLNRCYARKDVPSTLAHRKEIEKQAPFDLALLLHEDYDAQGIYLYEVTKQPSLWGRELVEAGGKAVGIDERPRIEGRAAERGVIQRNLLSKSWRIRFKKWGFPEAVYLYLRYCPRVYTVETPSEFDIYQRARAHLLAVNRALENLTSSS